jgi:hypothetical protein
MKTRLVFLCLLLLLCQSLSAKQTPNISETDRTRLAEAFKIGESLGNGLWKDWTKAPFAVLLVTPEYEFLIRHPKPSDDFALIGYDKLLQGKVYFRKKVFNQSFLATFPFNGTPTIVVGQAENTAAKTSTPWVVTMLHEHFHQLQQAQSDYFKAVDDLNLSDGDQTGMWMLNYAFPYSDEKVKKHFETLCKLLFSALHAKGKKHFEAKLNVYLEERQKFEKMLKPKDYKYFSFQIWQEGIARYTEYHIAFLTAKLHKPSKEFKALKDYEPFKKVAGEIKQNALNEINALKLDEYQRVAFYPFGACEGFLLDRANPKWRERYFAEKFYVEKYFNPKN